MACAVRLWHWAGMARRNTQAGGFFLVAAILIGAVLGGMRGDPIGGMLAGTALGIAAAVIVWLVDRRRG